MNKTIVCEVLLHSYKDLEKKCEFMEERAVKFALQSMNKDAYTCAETLLKLNNEKITLCNIKVVIDDAMNAISENDELRAFHCDGLSYKQIVQAEQISLRTFFRRIARQKEMLFEAIQERYSDECLFELVRGSRWIFNRYCEAVRRAESERKGKNKETNDQKPKTAQIGK